MTRVKICGNTNYEQARLAVDLGADYLGFIFAPSSKRLITVEKAAEILEKLAGFKNTVGVFCNQPKKEVETLAGRLGLKFLQFHGEETALYCDSFMQKGYEIIKTFYVHDKLFLAGGLNPFNVAQAIEKVRPFAVDVASGVESGPGTKDPQLLRAFIENAKGVKEIHERKA
jgi:phosphoribosylanthranilate isomerase